MGNKNSSSIYSSALPSYKKPPVNEVICGMRFQTPDNLKIPHLGLLWDKFRNNYPNIQHAPQIVEKGQLLIDVAGGGTPLPRVWFLNQKDDQLIQVQFDRFYFNWRSRQRSYPRYEYIIKQFQDVFKVMEGFFKEFNLGDLVPVEYELSYINHIVQGEGWNNMDDVLKMFSDFTWQQRKERFLSNPLSAAWVAEFPIAENNGLLIVNLKQATRREDNKPLFVLELRAKSDAFSQKHDYRKWYDLAHQWIVRGFTDLTTENIQKYSNI